MKNKLLTREIVQHIFASLGLSEKGFGKIGLTLPEFELGKIVAIEYEDGSTIKHKTYSAQLSIDSTNIRFLAIDLSVDGIFEAALVARMNDLPIHAMRLSYSTEEAAQFYVIVEGKSSEADLSVQCNLLLGIEKLVSIGFPWEKLDEFEELYRAGLSICN